MLQQVRLFGFCFVLAGLLLGPAKALGQNYVMEYSEDFSSDPGWTTDQPQNYFWDSGTGTYHATTLNDHGGLPSPTRYAYTKVAYDGNSMRLEFDIRFESIGWSAGVMFGLFDQYLNLWPSSEIAPDADSIFGSFGRADGGMYITLYVCDSGTGCEIDQVVNVTSDNTWYHCTIEYSAELEEATLALRDAAAGVVVADLLISGVAGLKPELDYLGIARDPNGNECCPSCSGYSCSASATASIDNVRFNEEPTACATAQVAKLTASDAAARNLFGHAVAISGNVVVVGALGSPGENLDFGKAYVFEFDGAAWVETAELEPSDPESDKEFGIAVAIDGNIIVVGAGQDGGGIAAGPGAAYVFERPAGGWGNMPDCAVERCESAKLTASDRQVGETDKFGDALGVSGDLVVVGARTNQDFGGSTGAAYIFERPSGGWTDMTETQKLLASDATSGDRFGVGVAIDGSTVVIGADQANTGPGKAYMFERPGVAWEQTATLTTADGDAGDRFGTAVALRGEIVSVGAFFDDDAGSNAGAAYIYSRPEGGWADMTETAKLTASDGAAGDNLGISVSVNEDESVLVGAYAQRFQSSAPGFAYMFARPVDGWNSVGSPVNETLKLAALDGASKDQFGVSVSIDGEWALVGASQDADAGNASGSAYVFSVTCNESPNCNAGGAYAGECEGMTTNVPLDGSSSSDPDGDPLDFMWSTDCPGGSFDDPASATPTLTVDTSNACDVTCNVTLTVDDGNGGTCSESTTVTISDTTPPVVTCSAIPLSEHHMLIAYDAWDACGQVTGSAVIETQCCPLPVSNGQVVKVKCQDHEECKLKVDFEDAVFQIKTDAAALVVTATDECGNEATCTVELCAPGEGDEDGDDG